jgi:predicted RNA-binding Zn-ribbon protein involved in translation (DUF1610 family)
MMYRCITCNHALKVTAPALELGTCPGCGNTEYARAERNRLHQSEIYRSACAKHSGSVAWVLDEKKMKFSIKK